MSIFSDTADALDVSQETRDRAWLLLQDANLSPEDPAVVQILIAESSRESMESHIVSMREATAKAIGEFQAAQVAAESAAAARLSSTSGEIARSVSTTIAESVERAVIEASRERRDNAGILRAAIFLGGILVGGYLGVLLSETPDSTSTVVMGGLTWWLWQFRPQVLLLAGMFGFVLLRLAVAWTIDVPLIRWLLALPARSDLTFAWPRSRHNHF